MMTAGSKVAMAGDFLVALTLANQWNSSPSEDIAYSRRGSGNMAPNRLDWNSNYTNLLNSSSAF
jgi:hypothetical protein